ncbi:MAG: MopE-related protein [Sandaracinaceae bacterium]
MERRVDTRILALAASAALLAVGCDDGGPGRDGGPNPNMDAGPRRDGSPPPGDSGGMITGDACVPQIEICGDRIDQNCDGRETPCGDNDMDNIDACRAGDDLTMCDCDDSRADVRPPFGGLPGAPELCDGVDNDCNGRIDEASACCSGCAGIDPLRADICTEANECDCTTEPGIGPCADGMTCCTSGCVDVTSDFANCGACGGQCTNQADRCVNRTCMCGTNPVCDFTTTCTGGVCGG